MIKNTVINQDLESQEFLSITDRLALFGYGLFETILINRTGPCFLDLHYERMKTGAHILHLEFPHFFEWSVHITDYIANQSQLSFPFGLRVTLSGGKAEGVPGRFFLNARPLSYTPQQYSDGSSVCLLSFPRNESSPLIRIKSTSFLENILAREEALSRGYNEGLWLNTKGFLSEGTLSNFFFIYQGELYTPALDCGCLPGTRRHLILELAKSFAILCHEGNYLPGELWRADEVFITNSLMGVMPIRQVDNHFFPVYPENSKSITRLLGKAYQDLILKQIDSTGK